MPKSPSRTSKKKKYNARFPPARIKKIMQTDEEVGKVAAAVPVIISRALEMFIESLITQTSKTTIAKNAKTLSASHIKQTIQANKQFDFLRDLVANVPDHQTEDNIVDVSANDGETTCKRGRGRPRKTKEMGGKKQKGESSKTTSDTSDEDEEEDDDEDTETDEEHAAGVPSASFISPATVGNSSDRLGPVTMQPGASGPDASMNNFSNLGHGFPPIFINPAMASLQKQQQLLQPHQQFQQQQYSGTSLAPFPYPTYVSTQPLEVPSYPLPPQYANNYPPLMPSLDQLQQVAQQPLPSQVYPSQNFREQQNAPPQQQPMNLSYQSRAMATTAGESDDYDT
ncbi:unnamed protein product [Lymnaea stagnalis]|uniref:Dr1-associated corepressor n=1 Tax=Lymnaea stagnalis TaxID=6523 RepID=A0AAV2H420_LYMST